MKFSETTQSQSQSQSQLTSPLIKSLATSQKESYDLWRYAPFFFLSFYLIKPLLIYSIRSGKTINEISALRGFKDSTILGKFLPINIINYFRAYKIHMINS